MRNTFSTSRVPFSFMCFPLDLDIKERKKRHCFDSWQWFLAQENKTKTKNTTEKSPFHSVCDSSRYKLKREILVSAMIRGFTIKFT